MYIDKTLSMTALLKALHRLSKGESIHYIDNGDVVIADQKINRLTQDVKISGPLYRSTEDFTYERSVLQIWETLPSNITLFHGLFVAQQAWIFAEYYLEYWQEDYSFEQEGTVELAKKIVVWLNSKMCHSTFSVWSSDLISQCKNKGKVEFIKEDITWDEIIEMLDDALSECIEEGVDGIYEYESDEDDWDEEDD